MDDRSPRHHHAPLTGLFRTVVLENPRITGRVVRVAELDTASPERIADVLRAEAADRSADCEIRYGADGTRDAARPVEFRLDEGAEVPPLKEGGVYWITGGLGGLGLHVARYFGRCAGVTVVLSGRSAPGAASETALRGLREEGVEAHYLPVDVGSEDDVDRAVRAVVRDHGAIDGIVHAAGILRDAYLYTKDASDVRAVLEPKVDGVLHLDAATRGLALDFFVAFSSVAGVFGSSGQSDYAAANAFLDAFAHHRRALVDIGERSGRTSVVSWPLWADGGMSMDPVTRESMRRDRGWEPLPTEEGLRVLGGVLRDAPAHTVVAYGAAATLTAAAPPPEAPRSVPVDTPPMEPAAAVAEDDLMERTNAFLRRVVGEVLHRDPLTLDETANLVDYGIDSLAILETTASLEVFFGPLSKTIFFEYTSIEGVAGHLIAEHGDKLRAITAAVDPAPAAAAPAAGTDDAPPPPYPHRPFPRPPARPPPVTGLPHPGRATTTTTSRSSASPGPTPEPTPSPNSGPCSKKAATSSAKYRVNAGTTTPSTAATAASSARVPSAPEPSSGTSRASIPATSASPSATRRTCRPRSACSCRRASRRSKTPDTRARRSSGSTTETSAYSPDP